MLASCVNLSPRPRLARLFGLWLSVAMTALVAGCAGPGDDDPALDDGSLRGELAVYVSTTLDGRAETTRFLRAADGSETRLFFDPVPDLEPGARIKIWGSPVTGGLRVTSFHRITSAPSPSIQSALRTGTPFAPRSFAFVLLDVGGGVNETPDAILGRLITEDASVRNYYLKASYGLQDITAQVFGPISYSMSACASSDTRTLAQTLRPMVSDATFNHYLWYFGSRVDACAWSGLASVGTPQMPSRDTWYNDRTSCVVLVQEPGHNFGMQHSSSLRCPGAPFADDPNECTASEYGDPFDPMGGGCRHMNAWQKAFQGWFGGCNGVKVTNSGTFNVLPYEPACDGVQFLQVKAPKARPFNRPAAGGGGETEEDMDFYYVEVRTPIDFDGTTGNRNPLAPMVLIHTAAELRTRTERGLHTFLLDMTPSTTSFQDAALPVGQTFTDPAGGLSITNQSVGPTGATIVVEIAAGSGGPTCLDGTAFIPPGPGTESCNAAIPTGAAGTTGAAGSGAGGTTGAAGMGNPVGAGGAGGDPGSGIDPGEVTGGCGCAVGSPAAGPAWILALAAAAIVLRRSRRRR